MRRATYIGIAASLLGALVASPVALALPATGDGAGGRTLALVRVAECSRGPEALDRHATFRGVMRRVPGTESMWMRFSIQERVGDGRFRTVRAPGLGAWRKSHPAVRRFSYRQRVLELAEGSAYRAVVSFRWYGAGGELIRRARRRSKPCAQPGLLPNLDVVGIGGGPPILGVPRRSSYTVRIVNNGGTGAPRSGVSLAVDGASLGTQSLGALEPGEARQLLFSGPVCRRSVAARVDPGDLVREAFERDNLVTAPCPAQS